MFQRLFAGLIAAVLALPVHAQDAGPLALDAGMRAYTTRVFVEPEVLATLSVGSEVSFYVVSFTAWDYPHAEGFDDTFVVETLAQDLRILAIGAPLQEMEGGPLREVDIRIEGGIEDIQNLALPMHRRPEWSSTAFFLRWSYGELKGVLSTNGMVVMVQSLENIPLFCDSCETVLAEDFLERIRSASDGCFQRIRRGVELTVRAVPCPDN